ncbi:alpha/beta-hydrolase [Aspergillus tubingensis]|uniref:Uncharacterized protein n=1 Tax=Aspergillus niger TaxID=5061 RepID=A0A100I906_ASPNG|nr:alpha/beta-hydrolase [Aspergillus tubingensis]GAQ36868.1 hypothetical protein AKAW_02661 [Aspergillus niger]GFN14775.1 alpha/beta-hydrolase [Aspergillus tubingensis]
MLPNRNYNTDFVKQNFLDWGRKTFTPERWDSSNSWIIFLRNETQLDILVFVNAGTSEVFYDNIIKFTENLKKKDNKVEVLETPNTVHVPYRLGKNWNLEDAQAIFLATMTKFLEKTGA